jgi:uncharacterized membrane protein YqhA
LIRLACNRVADVTPLLCQYSNGDALLRREGQSMSQRIERTGQKIVGGSRFSIGIAIAGISLSALTLMIFGFAVVVREVWNAFMEEEINVETAKHLMIIFIEMTDLFLLAMVLQVVTVGMYQLFINPNVSIPHWMRVNSLSDLKSQLLNVVVVLLAVTFMATAVSWTSDRAIFFFGAAIGIVIVALAFYSIAHSRIEHSSGDSEAD